MVRKGNKEITDLFEASFDGNSFNNETFDANFFIENSLAFIKEQGDSN